MYQVLARKYRPRNFIELVGQNHVSRALTSVRLSVDVCIMPTCLQVRAAWVKRP